ncbi:MAG: hypothetical protein HY471_01375 [Candidatus Sungbacteria bacterium]|nr:hypothetical protein [Candidatus Sungbacteria bacterium]
MTAKESPSSTGRRFTANLQYGGPYREEMEEDERLGRCRFCHWATQDSIVVARTENWFAMRRSWPYKGKNGTEARNSVLVMPARHVTDEDELTLQDAVERQALIRTVKRQLGIEGFCEFARYGDPDRSGATYLHFHVHLVEPGDHPNPDPVKDGVSDPIALYVG